MPQLTIVSHGDGAAVLLSKKMLEALGMHIGDTVEAMLNDRILIVCPTDEAERRQRMGDITKEVLDRRADAYQRLA